MTKMFLNAPFERDEIAKKKRIVKSWFVLCASLFLSVMIIAVITLYYGLDYKVKDMTFFVVIFWFLVICGHLIWENCYPTVVSKEQKIYLMNFLNGNEGDEVTKNEVSDYLSKVTAQERELLNIDYFLLEAWIKNVEERKFEQDFKESFSKK